jgi:3-phenylpropionate/cinnamic acid dioxygenase small subunit
MTTSPALARLLDTAEVTRVLYEYCELVDANRQADVVALFTANAVYDHGHGRVFTGQAQLTQLFQALDDNTATSHHLSNVVVSFVDDDTVASRSVLYAYHRRASGQVVHLWGRYVDTLVRVGPSWRLRSRSLLASAEAGVDPDPGWPSRYQLIPRQGR